MGAALHLFLSQSSVPLAHSGKHGLCGPTIDSAMIQVYRPGPTKEPKKSKGLPNPCLLDVLHVVKAI